MNTHDATGRTPKPIKRLALGGIVCGIAIAGLGIGAGTANAATPTLTCPAKAPMGSTGAIDLEGFPTTAPFFNLIEVAVNGSKYRYTGSNGPESIQFPDGAGYIQITATAYSTTVYPITQPPPNPVPNMGSASCLVLLDNPASAGSASPTTRPLLPDRTQTGATTPVVPNHK
jgi:hypothetical protein